MNAMNTTTAQSLATSSQVLPLPEASTAWVSALADGELDAVGWTDERWAQAQGSDDVALALMTDWHSHHLIGEALRGELSVASGALSTQGSLTFARQVLLRARQDTADDDLAGVSNPAQPGTPVPSAVHTVVQQPGVAANDGVFRWKMVAGLASITAVASVAWVLVGLNHGAAGQGAEVAQAPAAAPATVVVATEQGLIERDARMQALMQAHRQNGGGTAWQVPAGFLRAATHDATQR
jgi:sigma-E factor negative regulatory protein RseA